MPSRQNHRGRHPQDDELFGGASSVVLRQAVTDLSYLYTRGYSQASAVSIVGNRYQLAVRQRRAVRSGACSDDALAYRHAHRIQPGAMAGQAVCIDGYNLLITVESALSGAYLFRGRDGHLRDLASLHGSYKRVEETGQAFIAIGGTLSYLGVTRVEWLFDAPVSNSGRLRALALAIAAEHAWPWSVGLSNNTDKAVAGADAIVVSSDSWILDRAARSVAMLEPLMETHAIDARLVDLRAEG
jgi:hypothetical protein